MCRPSKRVVARAFLWLGLGSVYALPFLNVRGAFDAFIKIDGVPGESTDDKHTGWIEVQSFHHGISQPATVGPSIPPDGRANHEDLRIIHTLDKASPKLALYCCNAEHIPSVQLQLVRATDRETFYTITLSDVIVSSVSPGGSVSDVLPLEEVSFNYAKIEWDYRIYDPGTGVWTSIKTGWDVLANEEQ